MDRQDTSNLIFYTQRLLEDYVRTHGFDNQPYYIQEAFSLLERQGFYFDEIHKKFTT